MIETLLQTIPKGVGEIFAVGALVAALLWCVGCGKRENRELTVFLWTALALMLVWRVGVRIISARYAALLIYPAVILTAWACFALGDGLRKCSFIPAVGRKYFPWLAGAGLLSAGLMIDFHRSPYADHLGRGIAALRRTLGSAAAAEVWSMEPERMQYYLHRPVRRTDRLERSELLKLFHAHRKADTALIFDFKERAATSPLTFRPEELPPGGCVKVIFSSYANRRKRWKRNFYLYTPSAQARPVAAVPALPSGNLLDDGGLEKALGAVDSRNRVPVWWRNAPFVRAKTFRLPEKAYFLPPKDGLSVFGVLESGALAGGRSVRIATEKPLYCLFRQRFPAGNYEAGVYVQGVKGTTVRLLCDVRRAGRWEVRPIADYTLPDGRIYRLSGRFSVAAAPETEFFLVGVLIGNGSAVIDNFWLLKR